jgi:ligand-binding sensor domain-containing protein
VEQYDLATGRRARLYTTEDGLDSGAVKQVWIEGALHARTERSSCVLQEGRFRCGPAAALPLREPAAARFWHGARETARLTVGAQTIIATAGAGLWRGHRRLTPEGQLCANHVEALAEFQGALWVGTFDGGLCVLEGSRFRAVPAPFRMINDLRATPRGLYVAAARGLFFTRDGRRFRRESRLRERAVNRLAAGGKWLFATTPYALYALRQDGREVVRRWPSPAGSTALQGVAVSGPNLWLASEDRGVIRMRREKFESFDRASGLPASWVVDVLPAADGGVWAATLRNGAVRVDGAGAVRELGADPHAWGLRLYDDGGKLLFGTQQGVDGLRGLPDPRVHAILRTRAGLFVGTEGGLLLLEGPASG